MRRRELITLLGGMAAAAPIGVYAQTTAMPTIGVLNVVGPDVPTIGPNLAAFRQGLGETGYVEGQNVVLDYRWENSRYDLLPALAAELVSRQVDLIVTTGGTPSAIAAKNTTATIPVIFVSGDPVAAGLVASLSRPGGNLTGFSNFALQLLPKRLALLLELVPNATSIAMLENPNGPRSEHAVKKVRDATRERGLHFDVIWAGTEGEIDSAFAQLRQSHSDGVIIGGPDPFYSSQRPRLVALASRYAIPAIYSDRQYVALGGLISYGTSFPALYRQVGIYAGRILHGAKPAELPVQQPTAFELTLNRKAADALGITIPKTILAGVDEIVE